jgi:hypothetical protein
MAKRGAKKRITDLAISKALLKHGGKIGRVAEELGVTCSTVYVRIKNNPRVKDRLNDSKERRLDVAMDVVDTKLGDGCIKTARWVLDNQGEERGFGAKQKEVNKEGDTNNHVFNVLDTDDMDIETKKLLMKSLLKQKQKQIDSGKISE